MRADWPPVRDFPEAPALLGRDRYGNLWVPSLTTPGVWDRRYQPWNPGHWVYYVRSRLTGRVVSLGPTLSTRHTGDV